MATLHAPYEVTIEAKELPAYRALCAQAGGDGSIPVSQLGLVGAHIKMSMRRAGVELADDHPVFVGYWPSGHLGDDSWTFSARAYAEKPK